jgi:hypothetical protein
LTRRAFIGAAGAAGLGLAAVRYLPATPASASAAGKCFLGSNADVFLEIRDGDGLDGGGPVTNGPNLTTVPGLRGVRLYGAKPDSSGNNQLATAWPAGPSPADQGPMVYSIYPMPDTVLKSSNPDHTDTINAIKNIIATAPPNSYLNAWHEALTLRGSTPPNATAVIMKSLHSALNELCQGTGVTYGSIFGSGSNANFLTGSNTAPSCPPPTGPDVPHMWESVPDDLGFYGIDPYGNDNIGTYLCYLDTFITNAKDFAAGGYPNILIAETNNNKNSTPANRATWFGDVAARLHTYGANAVGMLTFWNPSGNLSGPWDGTDATVIDEMNNIINIVFTG